MTRKDTRRLIAYVQKLTESTHSSSGYEMDGRFLESRMYRGAECANIKPDSEAKREEARAMGWTES